MTVLKRSTTLLLLACVSIVGCDEGTYDPSDPAAFEQDDDDDDELTYVSAAVPFDPDAVDEPTREVSASVVTVKSADGDAIPDDVLGEVEDMRLRFAHALVVAKGAPYFAARSADEERIEITYLGKGRVAPADHDFEAAFLAEVSAEAEEVPYEPPAKYRDDATWVTGFNPVTRSEFEVRIPKELSELVGADGDARHANREPDNSRTEEISPRHQIGSQDTRVRKGAIDTAQTSTNLSRIVRFGGGDTAATGVLIGRNQVLTVGHRLYGGDGWKDSVRMRVGANGTDNHGEINLGAVGPGGNEVWTADDQALYWISSLFKDAKDNGARGAAYDIGTIVLPNDPIGDPVGYFNIADASNTYHTDMYNRGYANCKWSDAPPECENNWNWHHMFGDTNYCRAGKFSSQKDPWGYSMYGYHSCDASSGHSGSPLYRYDQNDGWVVRGVHTGWHRGNRSPEAMEGLPDSTPALTFTLITQSRKYLFHFYNDMYTSP